MTDDTPTSLLVVELRRRYPMWDDGSDPIALGPTLPLDKATDGVIACLLAAEITRLSAQRDEALAELELFRNNPVSKAALCEPVLLSADKRDLAVAPSSGSRSALIDNLFGVHEWGYRDLTDGSFVADDAPFRAAEVLASSPSREAIARIIDPETWEMIETDPQPSLGLIQGAALSDDYETSLIKADAILAHLGSPPAPSVGEVQRSGTTELNTHQEPSS